VVPADGAARLFADQRTSLLFSAPCAFPCTFRLYELGVILSSPVNETISFAVQLCRYHQNVIVGRQRQLTSTPRLGAPYVDCQSARSTPAYHISGVPSVVKLDLGGLHYSLWSPNPSVVEGDMKLIITPSADALWALTQLPPATPTPFVTNATAFQVLPPCNSGVNISVGVPSASATASPSLTASMTANATGTATGTVTGTATGTGCLAAILTGSR
jgi:hypothetical protein